MPAQTSRSTPTSTVGPNDSKTLQRLNLVAAFLHSIQGFAMIALSNSTSIAVSSSFASGPPGSALNVDGFKELFSYRLGPAVAAFSLLSAFFHLLVAIPWGRTKYLRELSVGQNRFRWIEYSLSSSLMIVLIAGVTGISDVAALLGIFGVNASMILFGWLMETKNQERTPTDWSPFIFGSIAGAFPWIAISIYLLGAGSDVPTFVYGIFFSIFVLFNCFAINQWLQYRRIGKWRNYLFGERTYIWLSLIAKTLLAWQIFVNVLVS